MAQETWLVIAVGAGFLLLGIAASPIGWAAVLHRRSAEERRVRALGEQVRALQERVERCEASLRRVGSGILPAGPIAWRRGVRRDDAEPLSSEDSRLIAVPKLPAARDRAGMQETLAPRYAALWELAESGASADAIARATGQPIGQIELILGLRRQMDARKWEAAPPGDAPVR